MLTVLCAMDKSQRRIRRSPSVKRRSKVLPVGQRLTLERVLGLTVSNNAAFTCDAVSGVVAYPAGCVAVLFNPRKNRQSHIFNVSKKTITSMAFSADGKHLVTGECGHQPAVRVWEVEEKSQVAEFHGHKFGVNCVAFSPNLRYIVSIGSQHDMMVNVWNWKTGNKVASNKVSCKVSAVAFGADSSFFVTVGNRHVKFWYLDSSQSKINQTVPLLGHSGILGEHKNNYFCDVACGQGKTSGNTYIITQSGLLCEFNDKRLLEKWVELRTKRANCITAGEEHIFIGCAGGVVRVFSASSLQFVATLPHPHHLGVDVATATSSSDLICTETSAKYPDVVAITLDDKHKKVSCIYNDHSLYVWDVENLHHVGKAWSFLFHSGCVWALEVYPHLENSQTGALPPGSFLTASSDNTIRVWNLDPRHSHTPGYAHNIYSSELLKVVYADPTHSFLCDINYNPAGGTDKTDTTWDGKNGVRSIRVSPDGEHLASGDRQGNVRIFDLQQMSEIRCIEAHESDVVCMEYSFSKAGPKLLASGSRDRLIHVFDVEQQYGLLQTLDDHSAAIQSVRFTDANNRLGMLSCGSDKSLLFRNATLNAGEFEFSLDQHLVSKSTMYDMIIHPTHKFVATACQDRSIRIYNMKTAKQKKKYCASLGDEGTLLRVQLDPSGTYVATSCTDKNVCVLEFYTGELTATVYGHSEIITGLRFTNDLKHLISVSADGCIFVWRLSSEMTKTMRMRMEELGKMPKDETFVIDQRTITSPPLLPMTNNISPSTVLSCMEPHPLSSLRLPSSYPDTPVRKQVEASPPQPSPAHFNLFTGPLPSWAKAKLDDTADGVDEGMDTAQPRGRWAQRYDHNLAFKSQLELSQMEETDFDARSVTRQEGGGLQGGMLASSLPDLRRETVVLSQQHLPARNIPIIDDDDETNVDDDEDFYPADMKDALPRNEKDCSSFDVEGRRRSQTGDSLGGWSDRDGDRRWSNCTSLGSEDMTRSTDFDDMEDSDAWPDATKIVYPPSKLDVTDPCDSTFQVYAAEEVRKRRRRHTTSFKADEDGETGHQAPAEHKEVDSSVHDDMVTTSTTAAHANVDHHDPPRTSDKEQFVKENFESVTFTPVAMDKFVQQVSSMEQATDVSCDQTGIPFSPRLSLSSRFLSRSRFVGVRSGARLGTKRNVDNHVSPEPKSKTLLAQYMEDMRSCLASTNWCTGGLLHESPEKDVPLSPPTKLKSKELSFSSPVATTFESPAGKLETENYPTRYVPSQDLPCSTSQRIPCAPTNRKAHARTSNRGRRASTDGTHSREVRGSRSSSVPPSPCHAPSYCRTTKSSRLKSASSSNLLKQTDSQHSSAPTAGDKGKATGGKTKKSCLTSSYQARHKSTPNLIVYPETGKKVSEKEGLPRESSSNLCRVASLSLSEPDICGIENHTTKGATAAHFFPAHRNQEPGPQHTHTRKSAHDRMLVHAGNTDTRHCLPCQDGELMDTHLMPPPSALSDAQHSLLRRAAQARKGLTSDLTLEQAKSILLGNSGILESPQVSTVMAPATSVETSAQCPGNRMVHDESDISTASDSSVLHQNSAPELFCSTAVGSPVSSHNTPLLHADFSPSTFHDATCMAHHGQTNSVQAKEEVVPVASQPAWDRKPVASTDVDTTRFDVPEHDQPKSQSTQPCAGTVNLLHNVFDKEIVSTGASGACPGRQDSERGSVQDEISQTDFQYDSSRSEQIPVCSGACHCSSKGPDCGENVELSSLPGKEGSPVESDAPCHHSTPGQHESQHCLSPQSQTLSPEEQTLSTCSQSTLSPQEQTLSTCSQSTLSPQEQTMSTCSQSTQEQSPSVCCQSPQRQSLSSCCQSPQGQSVSCSQSPHALSVKSCSQSPHGLSASLCSQSPQGLSVSSSSQSPHALSVSSCSQSPQGLSASSCSQSPAQSVSPRSQCDTGLGSDTDDTDCDARQSAGNPPCGEEQTVGRSSGHPSPHSHNSFTACPHTEDRTRDLMTKCTNVVADLETAIQRTKDLHAEVTQSSPEQPAHHHHHHQMMSRLSEAIHQAHLTLAELALHPSSTPLPRSCPLTGGEPASTVTQWDRDVMEQAGNMLRPLMWGLSQELCQEVVKVVREQLEGGPSS